MVHLMSGLDENSSSLISLADTAITGYTEWTSQGSPAISIGWDWKLVGFQRDVSLIQTGTPGTNLMFVDQSGQDIGAE